MNILKIHKMGNSLGATFSDEIVRKFNLTEGDTLVVTETQDGVCLTPYKPELDSAMSAFEITRNKYRNALKKLAQ